ncbi:MAG: hypothetical protein LBH73_05105 [Spirochaetaceae bacterium]|jgi:hypothetical protein|nr:hypothetical protein [Spirochaetaceae bacterium]
MLVLMNQETAIVAGVIVIAAVYLGYRIIRIFRAGRSCCCSGEEKKPGKQAACTRCGERCVHCARGLFK